jgi:D-alanyl-D-alanine carboxypeptidase (penicillin-binding protein 5/6)
MKKIISVFFLLLITLTSFTLFSFRPYKRAFAETLNESQATCEAYYLVQPDTGEVLCNYNEDKKLPIASMCKIMTLLLSFEAIEAGALDMQEEIAVSEKAASMGGSQVFLEANAKYSVQELIKSIVVCSANDSCVALAERICGSEELFVERMNRRAEELGMYNTLFANCTGLPKQPQYSCAKDVATMLTELLRHKEYYQFGKVWMDKFQHPEGRYTEISNTNKLVRFYDGCDGGKTGFTNEAGFCLAATAERNGLRVISVVIGAENSQKRFNGVRSMFDYAFANFENKVIYKAGEALEIKGKVDGGRLKELPIAPANDVCVFTRRGEKSDASCKIMLDSIKAPVQKGKCVGEMVVFVKGVENKRIPLLALQDVNKATLWDKIKDVARDWNG